MKGAGMHSPSDNLFIGTLERDQRGAGFLRAAKGNYAVHANDPAVPPDVIRSMQLRGGELIETTTRPDPRGRGRRIDKIRKINGAAVEEYAAQPEWGDQTVIDPQLAIRLETPGGPTSMRLIDLMTPIGRGQRALIVAPP